MTPMKIYKNPYAVTVLFGIFFVLSLLYGYTEQNSSKDLELKLSEAQKELSELKANLAQKEKELKNKEEEIKRKDELIETHKTLIAALRKGNSELEKKYDSLIQATNEAAKSVELFKKRAEADEMLLAKYSKVFFLNEHYAPEHLSLVPQEFSQNGKTLQVKSEVLPFLQAMLEDMKKEGLDPKVVSAYRSFEQQKNLKGIYLQTYGSGANKFSADQGYSEHQLGTTVDIINNGNNLTLNFENTPEFKWLKDNAWRYGFILSYPKNNGYYIYEPWHWRFVGVDLAKYLHDNNLHFYDLPQSKLNNYLIFIFDKKPIRDSANESQS